MVVSYFTKSGYLVRPILDDNENHFHLEVGQLVRPDYDIENRFQQRALRYKAILKVIFNFRLVGMTNLLEGYMVIWSDQYMPHWLYRNNAI